MTEITKQAVDSERGTGSSKHLKMTNESSPNDGKPIVEGKMSRSSSSSSASSFDPLMDSDGEKEDSPSSPSAKVVISPEVSAQTPEWSMVSASPKAEAGRLSSPEISPKQSPPIQTMGRPGSDYDPERIPSSIFSSKPTTPMEWSVASNESLFSIHMGNNSFSRDAMFLSKSGELLKPDELCKITSSPQPITETKSGELSNPSSLATVNEVTADNQRKSDSTSDESGVKEVGDGTPKVVTKETSEDHSKESTPPAEGFHFSTSASKASDGKEMLPPDGARNSGSTARLSDESGNSSRSFAFPVLTGGSVGTGSAKGAPDISQSKPPEAPKPEPQGGEAVTPKAEPPAQTRWFPCFSCCPLCC